LFNFSLKKRKTLQSIDEDDEEADDHNDYLSSLVMKSPKFISNVICLHTDNSAGKKYSLEINCFKIYFYNQLNSNSSLFYTDPIILFLIFG
jgi:hypothetical protein